MSTCRFGISSSNERSLLVFWLWSDPAGAPDTFRTGQKEKVLLSLSLSLSLFGPSWMKDKNSSITSLLSVYSCLDLSVGRGVSIPRALAGAVTDRRFAGGINRTSGFHDPNLIPQRKKQLFINVSRNSAKMLAFCSQISTTPPQKKSQILLFMFGETVSIQTLDPRDFWGYQFQTMCCLRQVPSRAAISADASQSHSAWQQTRLLPLFFIKTLNNPTVKRLLFGVWRHLVVGVWIATNRTLLRHWLL